MLETPAHRAALVSLFRVWLSGIQRSHLSLFAQAEKNCGRPCVRTECCCLALPAPPHCEIYSLLEQSDPESSSTHINRGGPWHPSYWSWLGASINLGQRQKAPGRLFSVPILHTPVGSTRVLCISICAEWCVSAHRALDTYLSPSELRTLRLSGGNKAEQVWRVGSRSRSLRLNVRFVSPGVSGGCVSFDRRCLASPAQTSPPPQITYRRMQEPPHSEHAFA